MKPFSKRNRIVDAQKGRALTSPCPSQLAKIGCAQKELNLQPAGYYRRGDELVIVFPRSKGGVTPDENPPPKPEASSGNRHQSVTGTEPKTAPSHKADAPFFLLREVPIWS